MGDQLEDTNAVYYCDVLADPQPPALPPRIQRPHVVSLDSLPRSFGVGHHFQRQATISQNNNRCCRNAFSKMNVALMFAVAFFAIFSTVFAAMYFTIDKKDKTCSAKGSNVSNFEKDEGMSTKEKKCNGSSGPWKYLGYGCVGAKDNQYLELPYPGPSTFIGAVKLVHTNGTVGYKPSKNSYWGGAAQSILLGMFVTDLKNRVIYPSPRLVTIRQDVWYSLPGYTATTPELVLSDFQNPKYLRNGEKMRIWYGQDLRNNTESNNHGKTCMNVYVYST